VLAVDVGSTASRADVFDAAGRPVEGGRQKIPHQFTTHRDGTSEIDPDQVVGEVHLVPGPEQPGGAACAPAARPTGLPPTPV
jgi:hypothetical protein